MGTNFYWIYKKPKLILNDELFEFEIDDMDPRVHIGKRSAAGLFCWNCKMTLCKEGNEKIHYSGSNWYDKCPKCNNSPSESFELTKGASGVELGFVKPNELRKTGITSCCSFSWAQQPEVVKKSCLRNLSNNIIEDEYEKKYTGQKFLEEVVDFCPVYLMKIGIWFS